MNIIMNNLKRIMKCPFCGEDDFDLVGLKYHILNYCKVYDEVKMLHTLQYKEKETNAKQ